MECHLCVIEQVVGFGNLHRLQGVVNVSLILDFGLDREVILADSLEDVIDVG